MPLLPSAVLPLKLQMMLSVVLQMPFSWLSPGDQHGSLSMEPRIVSIYSKLVPSLVTVAISLSVPPEIYITY